MAGIPKTFVGRYEQQRFLQQLFYSHERWLSPIIISGPEGVGKSSFLANFFGSQGRRVHSLWFAVPQGLVPSLDALKELVERERENSGRLRTLVLDGANDHSDAELATLFRAARNFKIVENVFVTTRRKPQLDQAPQLTLNGLSTTESAELFQILTEDRIPETVLQHVIEYAQGIPSTLEFLAELHHTHGLEALTEALSGPVYELPGSNHIALAKPQIIIANSDLFERLKKEPRSIFDLSPRKFEETIAELLHDMGMKVELTPQSHDDGRDILAYLDSPFGPFLTLVECKRYREDRKIEIDLVKQLYATLKDEKANRAMLVTTSSFTKGAKEFEKKYEWELKLRDYSHIVEWIMQYKQPKLILPT